VDTVLWRSLLWRVIAIALNVFLQQVGLVGSEFEWHVSNYAHSSPFVCALDLFSIILETIKRMYSIQDGSDTTRHLITPSLPNTLCQVWRSRYGHMPSGSSKLWKFNMVFFVCIAMPQAINIFVMKGIPGTQTVVFMYITSFIAVEILRFTSQRSNPGGFHYPVDDTIVTRWKTNARLWGMTIQILFWLWHALSWLLLTGYRIRHPAEWEHQKEHQYHGYIVYFSFGLVFCYYIGIFLLLFLAALPGFLVYTIWMSLAKIPTSAWNKLHSRTNKDERALRGAHKLPMHHDDRRSEGSNKLPGNQVEKDPKEPNKLPGIMLGVVVTFVAFAAFLFVYISFMEKKDDDFPARVGMWAVMLCLTFFLFWGATYLRQHLQSFSRQHDYSNYSQGEKTRSYILPIGNLLWIAIYYLTVYDSLGTINSSWTSWF